MITEAMVEQNHRQAEIDLELRCPDCQDATCPLTAKNCLACGTVLTKTEVERWHDLCVCCVETIEADKNYMDLPVDCQELPGVRHGSMDLLDSEGASYPNWCYGE